MTQVVYYLKHQVFIHESQKGERQNWPHLQTKIIIRVRYDQELGTNLSKILCTPYQVTIACPDVKMAEICLEFVTLKDPLC